MKRILCQPLPLPKQPANLDQNESRHCLTVLRLKNNDHVIAIDGRGSAAICKLDTTNGHARLLWVSDYKSEQTTSPLTLEMAFIKPKNLEWVIEKITELGVTEVQFFLSERCNIRPTQKEFEKVRTRLEKISEQSLKQCLRFQKLNICEKLEKLPKILSQNLTQLRVIAHTNKNITSNKTLTDFLLENKNQIFNNKKIHLMIGPEGGFSENEELLFMNSSLITLGELTLRAETAALFATSIVTEFCNILDLDKNPLNL